MRLVRLNISFFNLLNKIISIFRAWYPLLNVIELILCSTLVHLFKIIDIAVDIEF